MLFSDLQPAITKIVCAHNFIPHSVSCMDDVLMTDDGPKVRRMYHCEVAGIGSWSDPDADGLFCRVCQSITYLYLHTCPECGGKIKNDVCQTASCKSRLL